MTNILLVEDDTTFSRILEGFLKKSGYSVTTRHNVSTGIEALLQQSFQLMLLDYRLPDGNGLDIITAANERQLAVPSIIMTSFDDVRTAVKAMHLGASDYITKPVNPDALMMVINEVLEKASTPTKQANTVIDNENNVEGKSALSTQLSEYIRLIAPTEMSVIIQGESGTGKEYVARSIHRMSKRANQQFIAIDCGAISKDLAASELFGHAKGTFTGAIADRKGHLEYADGGTLFLDEVGNLSYDVQIKLLRAIQERIIQPIGSNKEIKVDIRIIAATNEDLVAAVSKGTFREDLYHRLNEFKIDVPPLRERKADLDLFVNHFIREANKQLGKNIQGLANDTQEVISKYDWPGNLRELKNVVKRMVLLSKSDEISIDTLPQEMVHTATMKPVVKRQSLDLKVMNENNERTLIAKVLNEVKFNKSKAARILNIDRKTLYMKIEKYGLE